jgi:hypothetical protein
MQNETTQAFAILGALVFASLVLAGGALVCARVLGLDRLWLRMESLPKQQRYKPAVTIGYLGIGVGLVATGVMLEILPPTMLSAAWAGAGVFVGVMGSFVLIAANQAKDAARWVQSQSFSFPAVETGQSEKLAA